MLPTVLSTGPQNANHRYLFLGDSWVSKHKMDQGVIDTLGANTRVTSICYSGFTSGKILRALQADDGPLRTAIQDLGTPTQTVILCGINDVIAHRGAQEYAANILSLASLLKPQTDHLAIVSIPWFDVRNKLPRLPSRVRNSIFRWIRDQGQRAVIPKYRKRLQEIAPLGLHILDYDRFADHYVANDYVDGVHISFPVAKKLAEFIARTLSANLNLAER